MGKTNRNRWKFVLVEDRFWKKVDKEGPLPLHRPDLGRCWLWTGSCTDKGYGYFFYDGQRQYRAHRYSYERYVGPVPEGMEPDHLCRVRPCVNYQHLEPVTHKVNTLRGDGLMARLARQTHCKHGHELTPENITRTKAGYRRCRECRKRERVRVDG